MRALLAVVLSVLLIACATPDTVSTQNRDGLNRLSVGMTKSEVLATMGTKPTMLFNGQSISNPYRSEVFRSKSGTTFEVLFYYTDVKARDSVISEDELTPIVFEDGKVVGWGNRFFTEVSRFEFRR